MCGAAEVVFTSVSEVTLACEAVELELAVKGVVSPTLFPKSGRRLFPGITMDGNVNGLKEQLM